MLTAQRITLRMQYMHCDAKVVHHKSELQSLHSMILFLTDLSIVSTLASIILKATNTLNAVQNKAENADSTVCNV